MYYVVLSDAQVKKEASNVIVDIILGRVDSEFFSLMLMEYRLEERRNYYIHNR